MKHKTIYIITHMLNCGVCVYIYIYIYIYRCGAVSLRSAKEPLLIAPAIFGVPRLPPTTVLDTYGSALQRSDRFGASRFHRC